MEVNPLDAAGHTSQTYASNLANKLPQQLCPKLVPFTKKIAAPGCMQWSEDGKLLLVFRDAIQIIVSTQQSDHSINSRRKQSFRI